MKAIHRERLQHLIEVLKKVPRKLFDISHYSLPTKCGTVHCTLGWAALDPRFKKLGLSINHDYLFLKGIHTFGSDVGVELFGLNNYQCDDLFYTSHINGRKKTPKDIIKFIERILNPEPEKVVKKSTRSK